jgi:Tol biopolymer transport system component
MAAKLLGLTLALVLLHSAAAPADDGANKLGLFEGQSDVGSVVPPGSARYDAGQERYTLTSAGANTWYHVDAFHYLWKKVSGDISLTAQISFPPHSYAHEPNPHRKAILMFRQTLDAGGVYAAASQHGSGMTALQYRLDRGANTQDIELNIDAPQTVRIEKRGETVTMFLSQKGEPLHPVGASITLRLAEPYYVGLAALSHEVDTTDVVEFSHVKLETLSAPPQNAKLALYSTLLAIQTEDQYRRAMVVRSVKAYMQSANWAPDGNSIYVYEAGRIAKVPYLQPGVGGEAQFIDTGSLVGCSGNYGLSPDGKSLAVSCAESKDTTHQVYVLPALGHAAPRRVTGGAASSYFHAWSPDSGTIAFTRGSADRADIFTVPAQGGAEVRLTRDTVNDGPDYSADGKYIYFDSSRSGMTQIWRMRIDGSGAEQLTDDDHRNSSPHISRDGKTIAFLSQPPDAASGIGAASIRLMSLADGQLRTLVSFQGDRGSFSMYGWGDANHLAFVSYQMLPASVGNQ